MLPKKSLYQNKSDLILCLKLIVLGKLFEENLKIFKRVLLTSSLFALSSATFAGSSESLIPKKNNLDLKSIFEKPLLIAETNEDNPINYFDFDTLKITVTGTRNERLLKDFPGSISIYDYEDIKGSNSSNWRGLFKYDASIDSQAFIRSDRSRTYSKGDSGNINIRGVQGNRILTQVDGITIPRFNYGSGTFSASRLNFIDFNTLGKIEVLKGSGSALYGSDALGGVVSLRSLRPDDILEEGKDVTIDIGTNYNGANKSFTPSINFAYKENNNEFLLSGAFSNFEELQRNTDDIYINDIDGDSNSYLAHYIRKFGNDSEFNVIYKSINKSSDSIYTDYNASTSYTSSNDLTESNRTALSAGIDWNSEEDSFLDRVKFQAYVNDMQYENEYQVRNTADSSDNENTFDDLNQDSYGINIQLTNDIKGEKFDQKITYGFEGSILDGSRLRTKVEIDADETSNYKSNPDSETTKLGFYIQDEISTDKWDFILGLRYENVDMDATSDEAWFATDEVTNRAGDGGFNKDVIGEPNDFNDGHFAPSFKALYRLNEDTNLYAKYDKGFRAPTWDEFNSSRIGVYPIRFHPMFGFPIQYFGYVTTGNPDLKAETSNNYEIGLKNNTSKSDLSIAAYYSKYKDFLDKSADGGTTTITGPLGPIFGVPVINTQNVDKVSIWGLELNNVYHLNERNKGFSVGNSISYQKGDNDITDEPLHSIQPFTAINNISYVFPNQKFTASLINTYVGVPTTRSSYTDYVPKSYIKTDLGITYRVADNLTTNLGIYNLFDQTYYKWSDLNANGINGTDDTAYQRYAQPGTSIQAGFSWRF